MSLRQKQSVFAKNISLLIIYAYQIGYEITKGEAYRTYDQQLLYFEGYKLVKVGNTLKLAKNSRKSKTMNSYHLKKLAEDLNIFIDGKYRTDKEAFKPLAEYWRSLHPENISGYDWNYDLTHFHMGK